MASIKISELEEVVTLSEGDTIPIINEGDTKQVSITKLGDILATKEYVNKTVGELADMGFTPIIVESLPTENIQTNTIYMILGENGEGENIYEEWMYINGIWEKVGSTGSAGGGDYYYIDITPTSIYRYIFNTTEYNSSSNAQTIDAEMQNKFLDYCNTYFDGTNFTKPIAIRYKGCILATLSAFSISLSGSTKQGFTFYFVTLLSNIDISGYDEKTVVPKTSVFELTWEGRTPGQYILSDVSYHSGNRWRTGFVANYLAKDNTTAYTPVTEYHPATKKYVDDRIAELDTSGEGALKNDEIVYAIPYTGSSYTNFNNVGEYTWYQSSIGVDMVQMLNDIYTKLSDKKLPRIHVAFNYGGYFRIIPTVLTTYRSITFGEPLVFYGMTDIKTKRYTVTLSYKVSNNVVTEFTSLKLVVTDPDAEMKTYVSDTISGALGGSY